MPVVDVHTHLYPPAYIALLRSRTSVPYIFTDPTSSTDRLVILPAEDTASTSRGRPIGNEYSSIPLKLAFMDAHGIDMSVLSLANPWLDWVHPSEAATTASALNDDMQRACSESAGRLFAFGTLPLSAPGPETVVAEIHRLATLRHMRGVVMGTTGLGAGLDDPALDPVWAALQDTDQVIFLHPHYGLPTALFGPRASEYGHVLPLALGFPLETTIAVTRMLLGGVFDRFPKLKVLLAHSGGTLPFLAGRIESCIEHDGHLMEAGTKGSRRKVWDVLRENIYLDAVIYSEVGLKSALAASGADRLLFGTDHPFFPPLDQESGLDGEWLSVRSNSEAVSKAFGSDEAGAKAVMGGNAVRILKLTE